MNDIITKLGEKVYKNKESDYSPTSQNYRPDKMNHFYQNKIR